MEEGTITSWVIGLIVVSLAGATVDPRNNLVERRAHLGKNNNNDEVNNDGGSDDESYRVSCELGHFRINTDTIIRTQDSRELGAKYVNETELPSKEDCLLWCCQVPGCNVAVFEEKDRGSCYLFDCGPPTDFRCKFTSHHRYTSAILDVSDARQSSGHHHQTEGKDYMAGWSHPNDEHATALKNLHNQVAQPPGGGSNTALAATVAPPPLQSPSGAQHALDHLQSPGVGTPVGTKPNVTQLPPVAIGKSSSPKMPDSLSGNSRCPHFQFECRSSGECIAIYNTCDGIPQCSDGSDESAELGCPPDGRKFFGSVPTSTSAHSQQKMKPVSHPVVVSPGLHNTKVSLQSSNGILQKSSNPQNGYATALSSHQNSPPQQYTNTGIHPAKEGHHGQRVQSQNSNSPVLTMSPDAKFVKNGYDSGYRRTQQPPPPPGLEGDLGTMVGKHQTQSSNHGRYNNNNNDRRPLVTNGHVGAPHGTNGNPDEVSRYNYNPEHSNGNQPSLVPQDYLRPYETGEQSNADDPLIYQHKGHEEGIRKLNTANGLSSHPVNNGHQEDTGRHYYDAQSGFDTGHQQGVDTAHGPSQYGPPSIDDYNMREYYERVNGYASPSSSNPNYISQEKQYQHQDQYVPQQPSYNRHSMEELGTGHASDQAENWSSVHHDPSYDESYSRNGPYSNPHVESNVHAAYNGDGDPRHSVVGPVGPPNTDNEKPKLTVHVVPETSKYWPAQTSNHDSKEGAGNLKNGPSVDEESVPDYPHHLKSGTSDERQHYNLPGLTSPSKELQQSSPAVLETNQSEGDLIPSPGMVHGPKNNNVETVVPKLIAAGRLESSAQQSDNKMLAKPQSRVEVNLAEVDISRSERSSESSAAILALTLGLSITGLLLVLVGCRLRMIRRRLLRGRSPYAHDADYLVNGMYL